MSVAGPLPITPAGAHFPAGSAHFGYDGRPLYSQQGNAHLRPEGVFVGPGGGPMPMQPPPVPQASAQLLHQGAPLPKPPGIAQFGLDEPHYGPDGLPFGEEALSRARLGVEGVETGWYHAESNRAEQDRLAQIHLETICRAVDERHEDGLLPDRRWTNDPDVFPDLGLVGTVTSNGVIPFPPHDNQFFAGGIYDPEQSTLKPTAVPSLMPDEKGNSAWLRLVDFAPCAEACHLFDETQASQTHCGKVLQGKLNNGHFVEALQAISLRPRLARQLFHCWDVQRSLYIARLYKHGTWMRVEIDDYVPVGAPGYGDRSPNVPICCRSDSFPYILWPSLIEKAYAKLHTVRGDLTEVTDVDKGGWEAIGGGGCVEEALADLTGGVAGRFSTADVTADRLFLYIHELQRDTLFVCRVNEPACEMFGVRLNPYYPNVLNRAVHFEGKMYVQMFCGAPGVYDGGLQDTSVPWALINSAQYPEKVKDGYFWITAQDFREYYDTIIECRLVNSGDVSLVGMPPPRVPGSLQMSVAPMIPPTPPFDPGMPPGMLPLAPGALPGIMLGPQPGQMPLVGGMPGAPSVPPLPDPIWYESVFANAGDVARRNEPEFTVIVPDNACPCEVIISVEQIDTRMTQTTGIRQPPAPILVKIYENVSMDCYSDEIVCKSNWIPSRDAMVAFCAHRGGMFKVVAEFADANAHVDRMLFRCYSQHPNVQCSAAASTAKHTLVKRMQPAKAVKWTLVGAIRQQRYDTGDIAVNKPQPFDAETDGMRRAEFDINTGWNEFVAEVKEDCRVM